MAGTAVDKENERAIVEMDTAIGMRRAEAREDLEDQKKVEAMAKKFLGGDQYSKHVAQRELKKAYGQTLLNSVEVGRWLIVMLANEPTETVVAVMDECHVPRRTGYLFMETAAVFQDVDDKTLLGMPKTTGYAIAHNYSAGDVGAMKKTGLLKRLGTSKQDGGRWVTNSQLDGAIKAALGKAGTDLKTAEERAAALEKELEEVRGEKGEEISRIATLGARIKTALRALRDYAAAQDEKGKWKHGAEVAAEGPDILDEIDQVTAEIRLPFEEQGIMGREIMDQQKSSRKKRDS